MKKTLNNITKNNVDQTATENHKRYILSQALWKTIGNVEKSILEILSTIYLRA